MLLALVLYSDSVIYPIGSAFSTIGREQSQQISQQTKLVEMSCLAPASQQFTWLPAFIPPCFKNQALAAHSEGSKGQKTID
jgi:hypothetical protein